MSKEEINYWLDEFHKNKHAYMSKDGLIIPFYKVFEQLNEYQSILDEIRDNIENSIDSINNKLSDKEIRVENGIIVNPINDYRIVRLKAIRMKCKELLQILDKVKE